VSIRRSFPLRLAAAAGACALLASGAAALAQEHDHRGRGDERGYQHDRRGRSEERGGEQAPTWGGRGGQYGSAGAGRGDEAHGRSGQGEPPIAGPWTRVPTPRVPEHGGWEGGWEGEPWYGYPSVPAYPPVGGRPGFAPWRRGAYLPPQYRGYVVQDYARFRLRRPPYGYEWVRVGDQCLLISIATGLIFDVVEAY
jgi:Ni/Co efflux regulator RcnB